MRLLAGVCGDGIDAGDDVRLRQLFGRLEAVPVQSHGVDQRVGGEVGRVGVGESELRGELCAERRGPEDVEGNVRTLAGDRVDAGNP